MKRNNITQKQRSNFFSLLFALSSLLFVSCEQVEDFSQETDADAVKVVALINKMQTRVAYEDDGATNFVNGDAIKVVNLIRTSKNEATYTTTDGTNWTTSDAMVWNSSSKNKFQAWYPVAEYSSYDTFTIPTDQSDATKLASADWMTASTGEIDKPGNGVLDLNFQHRLAKVTVNLTFSSQYPEGYQHVSDFTFYTNEETQQAITPLANSETSYTAILRPGEYADESYFIYLTMDGIEEHDVLGKTTTSAINLEAGMHYTFTLKVGKDVVSIDDVTVADWNEEEIDGGVAEEVLFVEVSTAEEFTAAIEDGGKIKLMDNITLDDFFVSSDVVLDMNGYDITSKWMFNAEDCSIIISGDGTIKSNEEDPYVNLINAHLKLQGGTMKCTLDVDDGSTITVSGGSIDEVQIRDAIATISGGNIDMLQIRNSGNVYISGGNVSTLEYHGGTLIISGGTFGFDPTSYLADGYTATENEGIWTVAPSNN